MVVAESEEEVNIVRGMALDAIFELQISQVHGDDQQRPAK